jgi:hypothetical protein
LMKFSAVTTAIGAVVNIVLNLFFIAATAVWVQLLLLYCTNRCGLRDRCILSTNKKDFFTPN